MKTTLEVPEELYREIKSRAALRGRKVKDFVAEGLRLALAADAAGEAVTSGPLAVFEEVRAHPLHSAEAVARMMEDADRERKADWRGES